MDDSLGGGQVTFTFHIKCSCFNPYDNILQVGRSRNLVLGGDILWTSCDAGEGRRMTSPQGHLETDRQKTRQRRSASTAYQVTHNGSSLLLSGITLTSWSWSFFSDIFQGCSFSILSRVPLRGHPRYLCAIPRAFPARYSKDRITRFLHLRSSSSSSDGREIREARRKQWRRTSNCSRWRKAIVMRPVRSSGACAY